MKFKPQEKHNQLIEKITAKHLVVGIDIAQQTYVARAVNFRGIATFLMEVNPPMSHRVYAPTFLHSTCP